MQRYSNKKCQRGIKAYFMKKTSFTWLLFILLIAFSLGCKKNDFKTDSDVNSVTIYHCMEKTALPFICFDSLIMDSRCPTGAICAWQGTALIKISFHEVGTTHGFIMSLKGFPDLGYTSDTTINGYRIVFTDLKPYPSINAPNDENPRAYFTISH